MRGKTRQIAILVMAIIMIGLNLASKSNASFDKNDATANTVYYLYPTAITPNQITFAIWIPIFVGLIIFAVYQARGSRRDDARLDKLAVPMLIAFVMNTYTVYSSLLGGWLSVIVLLIALAAAFLTIHRLGPQDTAFNRYVKLPITIFFAWITVATIVGTSQVFVAYGWTGLGISGAVWAAALILVATAIGIRIISIYHTSAYGVVLIWAFWGVAINSLLVVPTTVAALLGTVALIGIIVATNYRFASSQSQLPSTI